MCDNTSFRESDASYRKYQSAVNDIPLCSAVDYCHAAAFRLKLPSCDSYKEQNEYLAFIIPQKSQEKRPLPIKPVHCRPYPEEKSDTSETQYVPKYSPGRRWNTEYRSTIDDCARKRMAIQPKRGRSPAHIRRSYSDATSPPLPTHTYSKQTSTKQFVETPCFPSQRQLRTASSCRNNKIQTCEQKRIYEPLSHTTAIPRSVLYKDNCYEQNVTPLSNTSSGKRPLNKCIPMDSNSPNEETFQRSTRRPMPKCQFQTCR